MRLYEETYATDLNDAPATQVVGWSIGFRMTPGMPVTFEVRRAFSWTEAAGARLLGSLAGEADS